MVDSKTNKIYAVSITDEKSGNAPKFKKLLSEALQNIKDSPNVEQSEELLVGCDRRWSVEIAISTFKRVLGENISARVWCNVVREIKFKVMMYHLMIDDAIQQEMNQD